MRVSSICKKQVLGFLYQRLGKGLDLTTLLETSKFSMELPMEKSMISIGDIFTDFDGNYRVGKKKIQYYRRNMLSKIKIKTSINIHQKASKEAFIPMSY